ncbi:Pentafunctional AROM polypeptide [Colletotrichum gloeosporioides]|uniref:3-dehydroquinate dehydratase n=1 Tax=Colletotrichum gloeosporioides TaxID=474922 RepID=A0A8H4CXM7_COLGL|nr:Pentafunctional AROM polypeptide [Colletotrichum gloeosporioides]KAF3811859.1 Pentafunctional AROM polypeptide [Colletotrichum gloeosporioides]
MADIIFDNHNHDPRRQTFIIPLTYSDIALGAADIPRISHGGDIWEMRVDLLSPSREPLGTTNLPPLSYVQAQIKLLRSLSGMPILFTILTAPQGGKFPPDAENEALALMLMAVEEQCKYIDVEIEWSPEMINAVVEKKGSSKIIASFHDWTGDIRWTSDLLQEKYATADAFGDIMKLSIFSADVYDCHELALFERSHSSQNPKPLLAVGMGQYGQLSRILSPISLVTHELLPAPSAPGQLTLAELNCGRQLMGLLPRQ